MGDLFPASFDNYKVVINGHHIIRLLLEELGDRGTNPFTFVKAHQNFELRRIKVECIKNCKAYLSYILNKDTRVYELQTSNNQHSHQVYFGISKSLKKNQKNQLYQNPQMKKSYQQYGKCLYINIMKVKKIFMLVFSGINPYLQFCIFGISCFVICSKQRVIHVIKKFIQNNDLPQTIISMSQPLFQICKQHFNCIHIFCIEQISQNLKIRAALLKLLQETYTMNQWQSQFRKILMLISQQQVPSELKRIFNEYKKYNLKALPASFTVLGINIAHKQLLYQHLEQYGDKFYIQDIQNWDLFLVSLPKVFLAELPNIQYDQISLILPKQVNFNAVSLSLTKYVSNYAIKFLIGQQNRAMFCDVFQKSRRIYIVKQKNQGQFTLQHVTKTNKIIKNQQELQEVKMLWQCSCQLIKKTGLPCCHIMKLLIRNGEYAGYLKDYIDDFWIIQKNQRHKFQQVQS